MAGWEQILLGMGAVVLVIFFWPGAKAAMEKSKAAENPDWKGALVPIAIVALFIILLIMIARG